MQSLRIVMVGFGNVGKRLVALLSDERHMHPGLQGLDITFTGIFTQNHGFIIDPGGLDLSGVAPGLAENKPVSKEEILNAISDSRYDVLVELSTLSIENKGEPAIAFIKEALRRGKHIVTANKGPAAFAFRQINQLAQKHNCRFLCESAVMDGAPVFSLARSGLLGTKITSISGILNTTTNFVLSKMQEGVPADAALKEAQLMGFAEADPSNDLEGWDAAAKISVLVNILMGGSINPFEVVRQGISNIQTVDVKHALQQHKHLKLVCRASDKEGKIAASVMPELLRFDHPFAMAAGIGSILRIETDLMGPISIHQENPTLNDTAYGVLNDLITIARKMK